MKRIEYGCNICNSDDDTKELVGVSFGKGYVKLHEDLRETEFHVCEDCEAQLLMLLSERRRVKLPDALKPTGAALILEERDRQVGAPSYDPAVHDELKAGELGHAAAYCALPPEMSITRDNVGWPLSTGPYEYRDRVEELVKAGALIAAEIDRLQRLKKGPEKGSEK